MKYINLLPEGSIKELRLEIASRQLIRFFVIILVTLAIFLAGVYATKIFISSQIASTDSQIATLQGQLNTSDNQALQKEIIDLNTKIKNIQTLDNQHYEWSKALIELGNLAPADMHLDFLSVDRASRKVVINGTTDSRNSVLEFWSNVKKSSVFENINFPLNNLEKPTDTPFTFTFYIRPDATSAK